MKVSSKFGSQNRKMTHCCKTNFEPEAEDVRLKDLLQLIVVSVQYKGCRVR